MLRFEELRLFWHDSNTGIFVCVTEARVSFLWKHLAMLGGGTFDDDCRDQSNMKQISTLLLRKREDSLNQGTVILFWMVWNPCTITMVLPSSAGAAIKQ